MKNLILSLSLFVTAIFAMGQNQNGYQTPPKEIYDLIMATPLPSVVTDDAGKTMVLLERNTFPSVAELAEPELRLAGLRINPNNFAPSRQNTFSNIKIKDVASLQEKTVSGLPQNVRALSFKWNNAQSKIAFINLTPTEVELWVVDINNASAAKVNRLPLNITLGTTFAWIDDNNLIYKTLVEKAIKPAVQLAPSGPVIQENLGKKAAGRTLQDLIKSPYDEQVFEYYATAQLVLNQNGTEQKINTPDMYLNYEISPNGKYLLTKTINKPFSYNLSAYGFAQTITIIDLTGAKVKELFKNPSAEGDPIGFDDAPLYPHNISWRDDEPATVTYTMALDGGIAKNKSEYRDALMSIKVEDGKCAEPTTLFKTTLRLEEVVWGNANTALFYESFNTTRKTRLNLYNPANGEVKLLQERSSNDNYADLGWPYLIKNQWGNYVLYTDKNKILLTSSGASPEGNMPLIQTFDLATKQKNVLWQCKAPYYEVPVKIINPKNLSFITSKESQKDVPNYYLYISQKNKFASKALTQFQNPYVGLDGVQRQKLEYMREDGIKLTGNLYLPQGYDAKKDGPLPVLMWAYPIEYKSAADASQVRGSKYTFSRPHYGSPVLWVTRGYAILDAAEMPIVGLNGKEPNDNFIPQLHLNAHAAIKKLAEMGVGDSTRVAVGGHSYGAFMTANLLAHTNLFKAGIARSGAYNRTLTPFGFQGEERTYWEAPDVYYKMSPFSYADKIKTPLLLIHGDADNNSGTFPLQSERLYQAIKGNGGIVRFVSLPYESHGYSAKENILHMLWETDQWLEKYVKGYKK